MKKIFQKIQYYKKIKIIDKLLSKKKKKFFFIIKKLILFFKIKKNK